MKQMAVDRLGGECVDCGLKTEHVCVYDFHHKDPAEKDFSIGEMRRNTKSWEKIASELDKCVLLCANCHRIRHHAEKAQTRLSGASDGT